MIPGVKRPCLDCGTPTLNGSRCEPCTKAKADRYEQTRQPKPRGYHRAHARVRRDRGPANTHTCVCGCGQLAAEWALKQQHRTARYAWSDNVMDYEPRCIASHRRLDVTGGTNPGGGQKLRKF